MSGKSIKRGLTGSRGEKSSLLGLFVPENGKEWNAPQGCGFWYGLCDRCLGIQGVQRVVEEVIYYYQRGKQNEQIFSGSN